MLSEEVNGSVVESASITFHCGRRLRSLAMRNA